MYNLILLGVSVVGIDFFSELTMKYPAKRPTTLNDWHRWMGENAKRLLPLNEEMLVSRRTIEEKYKNKTFPRWIVRRKRFSVRSSSS